LIINRKLLKQNIQRENFAKHLQQSASELFRPITKIFQETQKKTNKKKAR